MATANGSRRGETLFFFMVSLLLALIPVLFSIRTISAEEAAGLGTISGTVWFDQNRNGIHDPDEPLMADHPVYLEHIDEDAPGAMVARVLTDKDGVFSFPNIEFGTYRIYVENGASVETSVSQDRGVATVELAFNGRQVFLPMVGR